MIHEIGVELAAALGAKGCPFGVVDGPELRHTSTYARERIVIEHDESGGDAFGPRHRADTNPRTRLTCQTGVKITIYAQSPSKSSVYWEHVRRAEHVRDMVVIAIDVIAKKRQNLVTWKIGRFVRPVDLAASETPGGAVYELLFTFDRGIADRNWDDSAGPSATIVAQQAVPAVPGQVTINNSADVTDGAHTELAAGNGAT